MKEGEGRGGADNFSYEELRDLAEMYTARDHSGRESMTEIVNLDKEVHYSMRFFSLTEGDVNLLRERQPQVRTQKSRRHPERLVATFRLDLSESYSWIQDFTNKTNLTEEDFGLFVSVLTDRDTDIVTVDKQVASLYRQIGGQLDFSFTVA